MKRECGSCQKCCEGHLHGEAYGHKFWKGRRCHFLNKSGCTIYENRPEHPCKSYQCMWLSDKNQIIPEWMKPDEVNAVLSLRKHGEIEYIELLEAGEKMRSEVLSWAILHALNNGLNIHYQIDSGWSRIGSPDFLKADI